MAKITDMNRVTEGQSDKKDEKKFKNSLSTNSVRGDCNIRKNFQEVHIAERYKATGNEGHVGPLDRVSGKSLVVLKKQS